MIAPEPFDEGQHRHRHLHEHLCNQCQTRQKQQNYKIFENIPVEVSGWGLVSTGSAARWAVSASGISNMLYSSTEIKISRIGEGETILESELEESLDDEDEHDSTDGTESSIGQTTTRPSSDSVGACDRITALRVRAEAGDGITSTLAYFPFGACDESAFGLFVPLLILSTLTFNVVTITLLSDTTTIVGTPAVGSALALDATLAFGTDFAWEGAGAAFAKAIFDEAAPVPFGAAGAFGAIAL
jgi:hypothetical protein